ncbi:MAG: phospholipase D-like domain-containing protein [Pseudomonadota bacterium]
MEASRLSTLLLFVSLLAACAAPGGKQVYPLESTRQLLDEAGVNAGNDEYIRQLLDSRSWVKYKHLHEDPIEFGKRANIPVQNEEVKIIGPSQDDSLRSLALKLWMIENAQHTIDVVYYIFKYDLAGQAMLGALCNAVRRGVDVRVMVDSVGSIDASHTGLMALETCAEDAGYVHTADGEETKYRARVQVVIFNALSSASSWANRRSHDKLLVKDGAFPDKAIAITGGRNISLSYYGIKANGERDPGAYRDLEILIKPRESDTFGEPTVGDVSTIYYSLLFLHKGNRRLLPEYLDDPEEPGVITDPFRADRELARQELEHLKKMPAITRALADMPEYLNSGFQDAEVLLAHELGNLTDRNVVTEVQRNLADNPNSITSILDAHEDELLTDGTLRIVSPYLFIARYYDADGNVIHDGAADIHHWLNERPGNKIEIITNSVLTSDNFMAQSMIDMDVGPRLLLTPELEAAWLSGYKKGEMNEALVASEAWQKQVNHPQLFIYETGKLDAEVLGNGSAHYGKLHAKFFLGEKVGFVGTSNFDYRSRLYNNEMGFFYKSDRVKQDLIDIFEYLKADSYRWGSPEWLEMRKQVIDHGGIKGWTTRYQRSIFKLLRTTGIDWLI